MPTKAALLIILLLFINQSCQVKEEKEKLTLLGAIGEKAMVATAYDLATKVGVDVLKNGGNAFDAAIAVKFALAVVFPRAGNIGGGGFALYRLNNGEVGSLDFREKAPLSATKDMYLDENGDVMAKLSTEGHLAAGVPGSVDAMFKLYERFGTKPMADLIQPAIDLANQGFEISSDQAIIFNRKEFQEQLVTHNGEDFEWVKEWKTGDKLIQKDLASTLIEIRDNGRDGFYKGKVAALILSEMESGNGLITQEDLDAYESVWRDPLVGSYRGHKIISMPPPSSGGVAVIQLLKGAEAYDIATLGHNTTETIHLMTELERRVYADRATHLGDPDFYDVPTEMLLSDAYNTDRFSTISMTEKTNSQDIKEGTVEVIESIETTHFSIVDQAGNAIAITTTLNGFMGCKVMVDDAGFFLNNEMDDFSAKPGVPNQFGLVGGEANAIIPEKRMLSSMTPTIVEKDGKLKMLVGTPGGSTIITCVFQTIMNVVDHGMTMQEAVNAKKTHSQWLPDMVLIEEGAIDENITNQLKELGHEIVFREKMGSMDCILVNEDGTLEGGADNKRWVKNYAEGF